MDGSVSCTAAAGEAIPVKAADLGLKDVPKETGGMKGKYEAGEDEQNAPVLDPKEEKEQDAPVLDPKEEKQVSGWNAESGTTIREEQNVSQMKKAEINAAKKGLGFFCYGSHGAYKPKF